MLDLFGDLRVRYEPGNAELTSFIEMWGNVGEHRRVHAQDEIRSVIATFRELADLTKAGHLPTEVHDQDGADGYIRALNDLETSGDEGREDDEDYYSLADIPRLSVALYCLFPKNFVPYYFYPNFHVLRSIFNTFGIFLPPAPPKKHEYARFEYYAELCRSLHSFWSGLGLDPMHLPVFLYGFAPKVIGSTEDQVNELPRPQRAWFLGAGTSNGDAAFLDQATSSTLTFWTGNKDTEIGDILIVYCLAPRSRIHSIWRAVSPGWIEPFRGYYNTIRMGHPYITPPVLLTELKADSLLKELPLIKANMQGVNGRIVPKIFYDRLLEILKAKGANLGELPKLENSEVVGLTPKSERDVERLMLEPLLTELGFSSEDWSRQVSLRVGRSEKVIPDYVVLPKKNITSKTLKAEWIWEAKLTIGTHKQLLKDFEQASSYARLVGASGVGLISKEGVWVGLRNEDYNFKKSNFWPAIKLMELETLNELRKLAGKKLLKAISLNL